ncbi:hypothetical protein RE428_37400 [Marinobacter nanhaiticus D15-8W]|uniref:Porin family protein n=1 Tax=Marinobacter nanhaiticus D15-8W TaxID=626887 RepID=N6WZ52_9GAMM|nr:porin family protein [Marinobacter nanhaiticus]ENO16417.1 porin family protein [Marinobacter nanhaiticus D15-8W]BES72722.1 hypothetical protein RE428_37400 [Marinobacter nanhaiticus D15-8W]
MKLRVLGAMACALMAGHAMAEEGFPKGYAGIGYLLAEYEEEGIDDSFDVGALYGQAGVNVNPYVAGELRLGVGVGDDTTEVYGASVDVELKTLAGLYGKVGLPNQTPIYPYVVAGISHIEIEASASSGYRSATFSDSGSDESYGIGANLDLADRFAVNVEYMQYYDKEGVEIAGLSIGGQLKF